jgi:hypothetical protein
MGLEETLAALVGVAVFLLVIVWSNWFSDRSGADSTGVSKLKDFAGMDPETEWDLRLIVRFTELADAVAFASAQKDFVFEVQNSRFDGLSCVANLKIVPRVKRLKQIRKELEKAAKPYRGTYTGWTTPEGMK